MLPLFPAIVIDAKTYKFNVYLAIKLRIPYRLNAVGDTVLFVTILKFSLSYIIVIRDMMKYIGLII